MTETMVRLVTRWPPPAASMAGHVGRMLHMIRPTVESSELRASETIEGER